MKNPESGPSPEEMGELEETGGEVKKEVIYETKSVSVPEKLVEQGYLPGKASIIVERNNGKFDVKVKAELKDYGTALDLLPATQTFDDQESAQQRADEMIDDIENWSSSKYD